MDEYERGYAAGYAGNAYGPHDRGALSYQGVAAYQRGYNAGIEARQLQDRFNARPMAAQPRTR